MSGNKVVLDSNAIIYASKGLIDAEKLLSLNDTYFASIITFIEVYAYNSIHPTEKKIIDEILQNLEIIELNREIADQAIIYRKNKTRKTKLPDAVILASAKYINADLITDDFKDFKDIDPSIKVLSLDDFRV